MAFESHRGWCHGFGEPPPDHGRSAAVPAVGLVFGAAGVAHERGWGVLVPAQALWGALAVSLVAGAVAGLYPALRAARVPPTDALRTA